SGLDAKGRLSLAIETYKQLLLFNKHDVSDHKSELANLIQINFKELIAKKTDYPFLLTELNKFTSLLAYDQYYNPSDTSERMLGDFVDEGYAIALVFFKTRA